MKAKKLAKKQNATKTRKQLRKEQRKQKKVRRNEYYTNRNKPGKHVLNSEMQKKTNNPQGSNIKATKHTQQIVSAQEQQKRELLKEKQVQERLKKAMAKQRKTQLKRANEDEDRNIKQLEKQLGLNKRKRKSVPKSFAAEGLDYLLEVCDSNNISGAITAEQQFAEANEDFDEDFALMMGKESTKKSKHNDSEDSDDQAQGESDEDNLSYASGDESNPAEETALIDEEESENSSLEDVDNEDSENSAVEESLEDENSEEENIEDEIIDEGSVEKEGINKEGLIKNKKNKKSAVKTNLNLKQKDEEENDRISDEDCNEAGSDSEQENVEKDEETWEDIYGRIRSKDGSILSSTQDKYIPPAVRAKMESGSTEDKKREEKLSRLKKQLRGLVNRLAASNMHGIASQIEDLYMNNSRNDMNESITSLIMESLVTPVMAPERLLLENVLLMTVLHANIGTEVGAHFLQTVVKKFDSLYDADLPVENKTFDNTVYILAQLYNFKMFHSKLLHEILEKLYSRFGEKDVECILLVLKNAGFTLRKDDPIALKNLILELQKKASNVPETVKDDSRTKFMLDVLLAIKNNNMSKIPNYDTTYPEHLKKLLKGFIRKGNYITSLNISLDDLLQAEQKGKWWVVGSAWTGKTTDNETGKKSSTVSDSFSQQLLDLARKQRMNTDTRRDIFCIIMAAEDYLEAFEKLLHLGLKNQQEREIIHVILHCCLQEKRFNPYYAVLAQKFCEYDRKFQMVIKYSIWDKLKSLTTSSARQISNLAKLLLHLFLEKGLPISILKIVQFSELDKINLRFMRQILLGILLCEDEETCQGVFLNVGQSQKLKMFRESLKLFIQHFLMRNLKTGVISEEQKSLLESRSKMVEKILSDKKSLA